ncbi:Superoxide dismutase [Mn/Fe] [Phycisphaerae bacterium RAS1]|nr:Superoxide dismutase [Mn/Fe] [Phycisphaerae bacterium RAS1]
MSEISRRDVIAAAAVGGWVLLSQDAAARQPAGAQSAPAQPAGTQPAAAPPSAGAPAAPVAPVVPSGPYSLPPLPYGYADLEPHIDAQTMKLHHDIHHKAYVDGANAAVADLEKIRRLGGDEIKRVRAVTDSLSFNLSGHVLHDVFWKNMKKDGGGEPQAASDIGKLIIRDFGALESFKAQFSAAAAQVQGSGWAVLAHEPVSQRLLVLQAEKHNNVGVWGVAPLLVLDVWEHAYYLSYQNRRTDYIKAFWNVVNWDNVNDRLAAARKSA